MGHACILVIEDDHLVREALEVLLMRHGYRVQAVASLAQLRSRLQTMNCPDLILADWRLPKGMNGADAINALELHFGQYIPAVVLTGETEVVVRRIRARGLPVLRKPVTAEDLLKAIADAL